MILSVKFFQKVRRLNLTYAELDSIPPPTPLEVVQYLLMAEKNLVRYQHLHKEIKIVKTRFKMKPD
jgi:hypothetical protein